MLGQCLLGCDSNHYGERTKDPGDGIHSGRQLASAKQGRLNGERLSATVDHPLLEAQLGDKHDQEGLVLQERVEHVDLSG